MNTESHTPYPYEPEFSLKSLFISSYNNIKHIFNYKPLLIAAVILGALLGAAAAYFKRPSYTARLTFVIDDSKTGSAGGLAAIAGQFGFNLDGIGGGSGVLSGDNVQELLKSQSLIERTLKTPYDTAGTISLADKYAEVSKLSKSWLKYSKDGKPVRFPVNNANYSRLQDSLLHEMTERILTGDFSISKTDKKLSFFEATATMKDEKLALLFCNRIIKQATEFYISTKTTRIRNNVNRLQHRADSIGTILNHKTYALSSANQLLLDQNPAYTHANANVEVKERDKIVLSTIFTETVKNLEASKTMLAQETPTVTLVDVPELPLKKNKLKYPVTMFSGAFAGFVLMGLFLAVFRKPKQATN